MKTKPKQRGWKEGILTEELRSGGGTHKKGAIVRYKRYKLFEKHDFWNSKKKVFTDHWSWKGKYEWYYLDQQNSNLIRSTRFLIEEIK